MTNKLKQETSPYLLQHAGNPVDWFPWGELPFELARDEDKPIFLSIGYAACHWCHVMAHESFEDPQTAEFMNTHFINIKVDREERPDVDSIYMDAVVALNGQGGWPLSVFLTPDGQPFYGGTYFPPQPRFNMPSFKQVLESIHSEWTSNRGQIEQVSEQLSRHLQAGLKLSSSHEPLDMKALDDATEQLFQSYDWKHGGWGSAPKFPQASVVEFLLQPYQRKKDRLALDMATHVLRSMARGGLFDQVGGGFHRYSVDERWLVPHFEKMLYDNAVLLPAYLHAWQITGDVEFLDTVHKTIAFLMREMRCEEGAFSASLDADSEGHEGKFYVWTLEELQKAIPNEADLQLALDYFGVREGPNFEGSNILHRPVDITTSAENTGMSVDDVRSRLEEISSTLLKVRSERPRPATDDKVILAWNGLLLIALSESARALDHTGYLATAKQLGRFMLSELKTEAGWRRTWRKGHSKHPATLRDLAAAGLGFLALYEAEFDPGWFEEAEGIANEILQNYIDPHGGFFDTHVATTDLITRPKAIQDSPFPSGNSLAVQLLLKLYSYTGDDQYAAPAEQALMGVQTTASRHPTAFAGWLIALGYALGPRLQLAIIGGKDEPMFRRIRELVNTRYLPSLIQAGAEPGTEGYPPLLAERSMIDGEVTAYLCKGFVCNKPTSSVEELGDQLERTLED